MWIDWNGWGGIRNSRDPLLKVAPNRTNNFLTAKTFAKIGKFREQRGHLPLIKHNRHFGK